MRAPQLHCPEPSRQSLGSRSQAPVNKAPSQRRLLLPRPGVGSLTGVTGHAPYRGCGGPSRLSPPLPLPLLVVLAVPRVPAALVPRTQVTGAGVPGEGPNSTDRRTAGQAGRQGAVAYDPAHGVWLPGTGRPSAATVWEGRGHLRGCRPKRGPMSVKPHLGKEAGWPPGVRASGEPGRGAGPSHGQHPAPCNSQAHPSPALPSRNQLSFEVGEPVRV